MKRKYISPDVFIQLFCESDICTLSAVSMRRGVSWNAEQGEHYFEDFFN